MWRVGLIDGLDGDHHHKRWQVFGLFLLEDYATQLVVPNILEKRELRAKCSMAVRTGVRGLDRQNRRWD